MPYASSLTVRLRRERLIRSYSSPYLLTIFCVFTPSQTTTMPKKLPALEMVCKAICNQIGKITKTQVLALCPFISASSVEVALKKLVKCGELTKQGAGRSTFYVRTDWQRTPVSETGKMIGIYLSGIIFCALKCNICIIHWKNLFGRFGEGFFHILYNAFINYNSTIYCGLTSVQQP